LFFSAVLILPLLAWAPADLSPQDAAREVLAKFLALPAGHSALRGVTMETEIDGVVPKLKKKGTMKAVRKIDAAGAITYGGFQFEGDDMVKKDVIVRYLNAEQESRTQNVDMGIHERNYKFSYKARLVLNERPIFVYKVDPRRKAVGLFKGEIWLDGESGLILRETGRLVKNPSIFFKRTDFQRRYELEGGQTRIAEMSTQIDTRLVGRVEMQIRYKNYAALETAAATPAAER